MKGHEMSFNIGSQTGGVINNVTGNQRIDGGQRGKAVSINTVRQAVQQIRKGVDSATLAPDTFAIISAALSEIESEVHAQEPNRSKVRESLDKIVGILASAGAIAAAGQALVGPIQSVALWVGSWGPAVAKLFHAWT